MRPLEVLLTGAVVVSLAMRWQRPRGRQAAATILAMLGIFGALHLFFDGPRWEMIPAYAMGAVAAWILSTDLRRVSGTKAGESSRYPALPSAGQRAGFGALLLAGTIAAVAIPAWAFPRVVLPEPDGLYDVGRLDLAWTDTGRAGRQVPVTVWYPAESPNGRRLRYHPDPGALAAGLAAGTSLPGFTFRNLAAARTWSTATPRFSIREGRSPLVLVSQPVGGTRVDGTAMYERLASYGYVVAGVGHHGSSAESPGPGDASQAIEDRVGDLRFALDRLLGLPAGDAADTLNTHIRIDRVGLIGRGEGAAAGAELAAVDPRVTALVAIVPESLGAAARRGVRRPLLAFTIGDAPGLDDALRYGGTEARLEGTTTAALSDRALLGAPIVGMLGIQSADAPRNVHAAVSALTLRFLDQYLKERREQTEVEMPSAVRVRIIPHQPRAN